MEDPKQSHTEAIHCIGKYLIGTCNHGIYLDPQDHSFKCYIDANFVDFGTLIEQFLDKDTAISCTGFVIKYASCPIIWASKLQTKVSLSMTSAEYVALSLAMREVLPLMQLLLKFFDHGMIDVVQPTIHCKVFKDNEGAIKIAKAPKI